MVMETGHILIQTEQIAQVAEILEKAGFADPQKYPFIHSALQNWISNGDPSGIKLILSHNPLLLGEAARRAYQTAWADTTNPLRPFITREEAPKLRGQYNYGVVNYEGDIFGFSQKDFLLGVFGFGATGTGKTNSQFGVLNQILSVPPKQRGFNVIIIQRTKREADLFAAIYPWLKVLEWAKGDIIYNPFEVRDWETPQERMGEAIEVFAAENFLLTLTEPPMHYAVKKSYKEKGVFEGSKNYPTYKDISKNIGEYFKKNKIEGYDMRNAQGKLEIRVNQHEMEGKTLNTPIGFTQDFWLDNDLALNVMGASEYTVRTMLMTLLNEIQRYRAVYPPNEGELKTLIFFDEARWIFNVHRDRTEFDANKKLEEWLTTRRSSGMGVISLTQEPQNISDFLIANSNIRIGFPVYDMGLERAKTVLNLTDEQTMFYGGLPIPGIAVARVPGIDRPFLVQIPKW